MKKFVAILLTLMLVLGMTAAVAEPVTTDNPYTDMPTITLTKTYNLTNAGTISPAETFAFSALTSTDVADAGVGVTTANAPVPTIGNVTYAQGEAGSANMTKTITITLPTYTAVGKYTYTFSEVDGKTAGVTYRPDAIKLVVTVIEQNGKVRVAAVHTEKEGEKSGNFENTYSAGTLKVTKTVTGNLGDKDKEFDFTVTFTKPEGKNWDMDGIVLPIGATKVSDGKYSFKLKHGATAEFKNLPYGVSYVVEEADYSSEGYTITEKAGDNSSINAPETTAAFTNSKTGTIDTGVTTESLPYVVLMGFVVLAGAALLLKRKAHNN